MLKFTKQLKDKGIERPLRKKLYNRLLKANNYYRDFIIEEIDFTVEKGWMYLFFENGEIYATVI